MLDHAEFLCDNCFFGASKHFYCFAADNKILVGYQKFPVLNYQDRSKNYLTRYHPVWAAWTASGQTVPISYDTKHIWVSRAEGKAVKPSFQAYLKAIGLWVTRSDSKKQVRLTQTPIRDIFTGNDRCRGADGTPAN